MPIFTIRTSIRNGEYLNGKTYFVEADDIKTAIRLGKKLMAGELWQPRRQDDRTLIEKDWTRAIQLETVHQGNEIEVLTPKGLKKYRLVEDQSQACVSTSEMRVGWNTTF